MTNYDQRNQHVNAQVNINVEGYQAPDPTVLLNQGIRLLETKSYQQSINLLHDVIKANSLITDTYYYLALALLRGRRPKILKRSEIEEIDQLLATATAMGDSDATIQWFRALIRDDYYNGNRMKCTPPLVADLIASASSNATDVIRLKNLLAKLPMHENKLYIAVSNQIS